MSRFRHRHLALSSIVVALVPLLAACAPAPIKIGVPIGQTGLSSRLGVTGRNGIELAAAEINAAGGIRGRKLELVVRDDGDSAEGGLAAAKALRELGVAALVGHMSSRSGSLAIPFANEAGLPLVSPTISSTDWDEKDDWFFRVIASNVHQGRALAERALAVGHRSALVLYESTNAAYTRMVADSFAAAFAAGGGRPAPAEPLVTGQGFDYRGLASRLEASKSDLALVVAGPVDCALLCQELEKLGSDLPVYAGMWAMTDDLLAFGGRGVERMTVVGGADLADRSPAFLAFAEAYGRRYGESPTFASVFGYEAMSLLGAALGRARDASPAAVKSALAATGTFAGLQGDIALDRFGDCARPYLVFDVREGSFVRAAAPGELAAEPRPPTGPAPRAAAP